MNVPDYYDPSDYEDYINGVGAFFDWYAAEEYRWEIESEAYDMYYDDEEA